MPTADVPAESVFPRRMPRGINAKEFHTRTDRGGDMALVSAHLEESRVARVARKFPW